MPTDLSRREDPNFQPLPDFLAPSKGHQMLADLGLNNSWCQGSYSELKATRVRAVASVGWRGVGMFADYWRILTYPLLRIWTVMPGWPSATTVCCEEPLCFYEVRQHGWCPTTLHVDLARWPSCSWIQPLRTNLQSMICMSQPRSIWIIISPVFTWRSPRNQGGKKKTQKLPTLLLKMETVLVL